MAIWLRGKTTEDCLRRTAAVCDIVLPLDKRPSTADVRAAFAERGLSSTMLLLHELDDAKEPERIAELIGQLAKTQRVLMGTRRNRSRGPGQDPTNPGPLAVSVSSTASSLVSMTLPLDTDHPHNASA